MQEVLLRTTILVPKATMNIYRNPQQLLIPDNVAAAATATTATSKSFVKHLLDDSVDMNDTISSKLNELSMKERTKCIHELHGIPEGPVPETREIRQAKLREVNEAVSKFRKDDTVAYQMACEKDKKYVDGIKLLCLRADQFNGQKAATRLVSYFSFKQSLFGDKSLARDIALDDLKDEDKEGMHKGIVRLLPEKDRAGRSILMAITEGERHPYKTETWVSLSQNINPSVLVICACSHNSRLPFFSYIIIVSHTAIYDYYRTAGHGHSDNGRRLYNLCIGEKTDWDW
jgi:hypothetical protein